jgi:hypothetical protein
MPNKEYPVKTYSLTSPQDSSRGCLCPDNTYDKECCNGDIYAQGVGQLENQATAVVNQIIVTRQIP